MRHDNVDVTATAPADWDAYVGGHPGRTAYHLAKAVSIGNAAFGLRTCFLTVRGPTGALTGILPLVEQSSVLFGRYLVSVPFFTYGGYLADDDAAGIALVEAAARLAAERKAQHVELRHVEPVAIPGLKPRLDKVSLMLDLPDTEEKLGKQLGSKLRSQIRRAERESPEIRWGGSELLADFHAVFAPGMRDLGTPVYPLAFFRQVLIAFGELASVVTLRVKGKVQAAAIVLRHGDSIEVPWAAATLEAKQNAVNMRMYWEMLALSVREGRRRFDFGRSSVDSGTYRFKLQWGARPHQLHWYYSMAEGRELPMLNHSNPKFALAAAAWKRLPLWAANFLGPHIVRNLP